MKTKKRIHRNRVREALLQSIRENNIDQHTHEELIKIVHELTVVFDGRSTVMQPTIDKAKRLLHKLNRY